MSSGITMLKEYLLCIVKAAELHTCGIDKITHGLNVKYYQQLLLCLSGAPLPNKEFDLDFVAYEDGHCAASVRNIDGDDDSQTSSDGTGDDSELGEEPVEEPEDPGEELLPPEVIEAPAPGAIQAPAPAIEAPPPASLVRMQGRKRGLVDDRPAIARSHEDE